ncbi:MAG TPA: hypothetical protein VGX70_13600 [Gemmataceae bacterium]|jgi:hypothetical protein|nr:hypothetical protein [Gemmataceae bacterium]
MKSISLTAFFMLSTVLGCVTLPSLKEDPKPAAKAPAASQELAPTPVNPDEITDRNAHEKVEALRKELSREDK